MVVHAPKLKQQIYGLSPAQERFLYSDRYIDWLAQTHPHLNIKNDSLGVTYQAPLQFFEPLKPGILRKFMHFATLKCPQLFAPKALFLGVPFEPYEQLSPLQLEMIPELQKRAREEGCGVIVLTNVDASQLHTAELETQGIKVVPSFPDMVLSLPGKNFKDFLNARKSKERNSILRNMRRFDESGFTVRRVCGEALRSLSHQMLQGYHHMYVRAEVKWLRHTAAYFDSLSEYGEDVFVDVAFTPGKRLAGFVVSFNDGKRLHGGRIGLTPSQYQKNGVYFRLIYRLIERGYMHQKEEVVLEPTTFKFKRYLGAQYRPLVNLILGATPFWATVCSIGHRLGQRWLRHLNRPHELEKYY